MASRRQLKAIAVGAGAMVLCVAAAALLVRSWLLFRRSDAELKAHQRQLEALFAHDPFPTPENVAQEEKNLAVLEQEVENLLVALRQGQVEPVAQGPEKFIAEFWETRNRLLEKAREAGVTVPNDFAFGFSRLMSGILPAQADVARLTQQLRIVEGLCQTLFAARIQELRGVGREEFEQSRAGNEESAPPARTPASRRADPGQVSLNTVNPDAGLVPPDALYGKWHFVLDFTAKESALLAALNALARHPTFVVVTRMELTGDDKGVVRRPEAARAARERREAAETEAETRDMRIVCGQDVPVGVRLELDVYQFRPPPTPAPAAAKEG